MTSRRTLLQSMLATPLLAGIAPLTRAFADGDDALITSPEQALDVFDFERVARAKLPPAHFGVVDNRRG